VQIVELGPLGCRASVVERNARVVGVMLLLPEEVLTPLGNRDGLAAELAGVAPIFNDGIKRGLVFGGACSLTGYYRAVLL
jgi:hypothetical protein